LDKEIVRNMRTLWHSVPQHVLVQKLLSKQPNQEKYFYAALLKHREESLENYTGGPDSMAHSNSDYHHTKPADVADAPPVPQTKQTSRSSYSIMNNEHLRSSSMAEVPPMDPSYEPYSQDRQPLAEKPTNNVKPATHRRQKSGSAKGAALRVETLKKANRQATTTRKQSPMPATHSRGHSRSMSRSSVSKASRHSLTSSVWPSSPPVAGPVRSVSSHKRNVSFQHVRKSSTASAVAADVPPVPAASYTPELQQKAFAAQKEAEEESNLAPSPTPKSSEGTARKSKAPAAPRGRNRKSETPGHIIRSEVRKVSSELEKACEEAFYRSSYGSSQQSQQRSSYTEPASPLDTPPSSVSGHGTVDKPARPLPAVPALTDTPNTSIALILEETRLKLAARSAVEGDMEASRYQEVLAKLEKLMPAAELERRVTSAPEPKSATEVGVLPVITEEPLPDTLRVGKKEPAGPRSFTAPHASNQAVNVPPEDTIRVVAPSPQAVRAQTEYRRTSLTAPEEIERPKTADGNRPSSNHLQVPNPRDQLLRKNSHDSAVGFKMHGALQDDATVLPMPEAITKKKSSWFKRWKDGKEPQQTAASTQQMTEPHPGVPVQFKELDDRELDKAQPNQLKRDKQAPQPIRVERPGPYTAPSSASSEFPLRKSPDGESSKLSRWFNKLSGDKRDEQIKAIEIKSKPTAWHTRQSLTNPILGDSFLSPNPSSTSPPTAQFPLTPATPSAPTSSWFSRFLRLKPEQQILCFSVPRGRARSETYKLLRDWQKHGISDLCYFPQENMITARVDKINALGIKPVAFRVELFVVLQNGRKVGLSLGRWTQTRGAASSFKQVVEIVEQSMRAKEIMVADADKCRELEGILG